jgi:hypothetical protein
MLKGLKDWFSGAPQSGSAQAWDAIPAWAEEREYAFRGVRGEGFVIDGRLGAAPWRLEWGPSQRPYVQGHELRLRAEMGLVSGLQALVMNRTLQETLEKAVFEQYVEGVQTRIDNQTPPEMRWLVMFPKLPGADMGALREGFVALSSSKSWLVQWLGGPLAEGLAAFTRDPATPLVLMIGRGRLMLRTAMDTPDVPSLLAWLRLFEVAMREARRVSNDSPDALTPSTQPSLWTNSVLPDEPAKLPGDA